MGRSEPQIADAVHRLDEEDARRRSPMMRGAAASPSRIAAGLGRAGVLGQAGGRPGQAADDLVGGPWRNRHHSRLRSCQYAPLAGTALVVALMSWCDDHGGGSAYDQPAARPRRARSMSS